MAYVGFSRISHLPSKGAPRIWGKGETTGGGGRLGLEKAASGPMGTDEWVWLRWTQMHRSGATGADMERQAGSLGGLLQ